MALRADPLRQSLATGLFARESFSLDRRPSGCSIHAPPQRAGLGCLADRGPPPGPAASNRKQCHPSEGAHRSGCLGRERFHHFRYVIVLMGGLAVGFMSLLRLNITVAILNMVNQTHIYLSDNPKADLSLYLGDEYKEEGEFHWDNGKQQLMISYYMIAYTVSAAPFAAAQPPPAGPPV